MEVPLVWKVHSELSKTTVWKKGKVSNFAVQKPSKHYLYHGIKVNINSAKSC